MAFVVTCLLWETPKKSPTNLPTTLGNANCPVVLTHDRLVLRSLVTRHGAPRFRRLRPRRRPVGGAFAVGARAHAPLRG